MDIKQLKYLVALDKTQHFGQAAELCHISQPTLSQRIRQLEQELDLTLIRRGQKFEGFTEEGDRILAWANTLLANYQGLMAEAVNCHAQSHGLIRIAMVPLSGVNPADLLTCLYQALPNLRCQIHTLSTTDIHQQLKSNQIDLAISYREKHLDDALSAHLYRRAPLGLLYHPESFKLPQVVDLAKFAKLPLATLSKAMHFRQLSDAFFSAHQMIPKIHIECDSVYHLIQCVEAGHACALLPCCDEYRHNHPQLQFASLKTPLPEAELHLMARRQDTQSRLVKQCIELLLAQVNDRR